MFFLNFLLLTAGSSGAVPFGKLCSYSKMWRPSSHPASQVLWHSLPSSGSASLHHYLQLAPTLVRSTEYGGLVFRIVAHADMSTGRHTPSPSQPHSASDPSGTVVPATMGEQQDNHSLRRAVLTIDTGFDLVCWYPAVRSVTSFSRCCDSRLIPLRAV